MHYFLSGPVTHAHSPIAAFAALAESLRKKGLVVTNPFELNIDNPLPNPVSNYDINYHNILRRSLKALLSCDAVVLMKGWEGSKGANIEVALAQMLNLQFYLCNGKKLIRTGVTSEIYLTPLLPSDFIEIL